MLVGLLSGWCWAPKRRLWSAAALGLTIAGYTWQWQNARDEIDLTVLPLNGGHAVFVDAPGRENDWLVDCGNDRAVGFTLKPFLRGQGVNQVQRLVLTHGDLKNVGGAEPLDRLFGVGELWTSRVKFRSAAYREIVAGFETAPARHQILDGGAVTGRWQALHPGAGNNFPRADDNALVLRGDYSGARILLLSDLGREGQSALLDRTNDLRADIVIAGLPDTGEPLGDALLAAIQPRVIVVADSEFPATRRAGLELKERLAFRNVPVIYTRTAGVVQLFLRDRTIGSCGPWMDRYSSLSVGLGRRARL